jgi:hydroxyacylglutathione hydrolase
MSRLPKEEFRLELTIKVISLGGANCYLLRGPRGYLIVDTCASTQRKKLIAELESAGCLPRSLKLIVLTHGDYDHVGNAAFLKNRYDAPIAMHAEDSGMVERGNISWNRKVKPDLMSGFMRMIIFLAKNVAGQGRYETFVPDVELDESTNLTQYGFNAKVIYLPGHSKGSIGILTDSGDLFCGDLLYNIPGLKFIDNQEEHTASIRKLYNLKPKHIYPGHGKVLSESRMHSLS